MLWKQRRGASIEVLFTSFGDYLPDVENELPIALKTYPNYIKREEGLDLDTSTMLLSDGAIIDESAFDYICEKERAYLRPMANSLRKLQDTGLLRKVNFKKEAKKFELSLKKWVESELEEAPERWRWALIEQFKNQRPLAEEQLPVIGSAAVWEYERLPFGIIAYLCRTADKIDMTEAQRIMRLLKRNRFNQGDREVIKDVVRPNVTQVMFDRLLASRLGAVFVPWPDQKPFYSKIINPETDQSLAHKITKDQIEECIRIFRSVIPELALVSAEELDDFLQDKMAVRSLRRAIQHSINKGIPLTNDDIAAVGRETVCSFEQGKEAADKVKVATTIAKITLTAGGHILPHDLIEKAGHWTIEAGENILEALGLVSEETIFQNARVRNWWYSKLSIMENQREAARYSEARKRLTVWPGSAIS